MSCFNGILKVLNLMIKLLKAFKIMTLNLNAHFKGLEINGAICLLIFNLMLVFFFLHDFNGAINFIVNNARNFCLIINMRMQLTVNTGVIQKVLPVLSTETLMHIWLSTEYYGFRLSSTAVDTGDTRGLMMSK